MRGGRILSAIIFNAIIIVALIPLALRGVRYRPASASSILGRNLLITLVGQFFTDADGVALPEWFRFCPSAAGEIPAGAVTASASGLDPHISPAYALQQVPRVAAARDLSGATVRALVESVEQGRDLRFLGEPTVNVLNLNLELAKLDSSR
ncbi:potassium-transporting ATPase subunit C [Cryobacterium adonitolivorans]|uniref:Potassium-transporting ATPase subunit C n=1 Tax=Cryobacterium adonitolivorans TaxID=1259189 RepID=A0A4R8W2R4_9MICO|nr:potassium-transporting ATPase subunit C [Cryobacterium adonitolivorans]TFB99606.1 potassium-transporting ATPase subunit C [Cryobacterium adonitolivorans]